MRTPAHRPLAAIATAIAGALMAAHQAHAGNTLIVLSCLDSGTPPDCRSAYDATLRMAYTCAQDGDVIDLTRLQCSTIALASALSNGVAANLEIRGPGRDRLTIDGGGAHRVLQHVGVASRLIVQDLTIAHGRYALSQDGQGGGCIVAAGSLNLVDARVSDCVLTATQDASARGGGVFAAGYVALQSSIVSGSHADSDQNNALGGGVYAGTQAAANHSTIVGNDAHVANAAAVSAGGGVYAAGRLGAQHDFTHSLLSGNSAGAGAAAYLRSAGGALFFDSTVASNHVVDNGTRAGPAVLDIQGVKATWMTTAGNTFEGGVGYDLRVGDGEHVTLYNVVLSDGITGTNAQVVEVPNLIRHADPQVLLPPGTLTGDPKLGELRANGGPTLTMAPRPGSPLIGTGDVLPGEHDDQRGAPRNVTGSTDIGAVESETLFLDGFD